MWAIQLKIKRYTIMKEISMSTYQEMHDKAWDMAVKDRMVKDNENDKLKFGHAYFEHLLWEEGYRIVD